MRRKNAGFLVCAVVAAVCLSLAAPFPGEAQSLSPLTPGGRRWGRT